MMFSVVPKPDDSHISVAVGITIGLIASFVQSLGLTVQRKSHVLNQAHSEENRRPDYRRPLWLVGFTIFISSNILGSIFQIASLPVVILAPLGAVSLLWNAFFARILLGDVFSKFMILGTLLIGAGAVLIAIFGIVDEPTHSLDDLLDLFGRKTFVVYFSLLGLIVVAVLVITHLAEWRYNARRITLVTPPGSPLLPAIPDPPSPAASVLSERTHLLDNKATRPLSPGPPSRTPTLLAVSYASVSGLLSGMCLLFAKSGVELLVLTVRGNNQFWRWESWMLVGGLVVFALLQLWYLHKSLVLEDPTLVCPLAFCFYNLSSILNGLIYFDQFDQLSTKQFTLVILGIVILLGGVWAVSIQAGEGEDGGVREGDWMEADAETLGAMDLEHQIVSHTILEPIDEGIDLLDGPTTPKQPNGRRTVSSPSNLVTSVPISPTSADSEPTTPLGSSLYPMTTPKRQRTLSASDVQSPPLISPISPPRRSRTRRGTLLSPGGGTPALGGFSIGLSPLSPGFSLVPRARRRAGSIDGDDELEHPGATTSTEHEDPPNVERRRWAQIRDRIINVRRWRGT